MESFKCGWYKVGDAFLTKHWPPENIDLLEAKRGYYTISQIHLRMWEILMVDKLKKDILNPCENQAFFNNFHSKVLFFILVHVPFQKDTIIIECLCKYSNHCLLFMNREDISYLAQHIFRKYLQEYYTFSKDAMVEKKLHVLILMISFKIEM